MFKIGLRHKKTGWDKDLIKRLKKAAEKEVAVGYPAGKPGLKTPSYEGGASITEVAVYTNFGTNDIPRYAFMEQSARKTGDWFRKYMQKSAKAIVRGEADIDTVLEKAGMAATGIVKEVITEIQSPANKPTTVKKKKSANPLIDTGAMRDAVTHHVRDKK